MASSTTSPLTEGHSDRISRSCAPRVTSTRNTSISLNGNVKGRDLFDSMVWKDPLSTSVFYKFIASLRRKVRDEVRQTTATHKFIRNLRDKRKLVRCYTQNIDGLEARDGLCLDLTRGKGSRGRFSKKSIAKPRPLPVPPGGDLDGGCEVVQLHGDLEVLRCNLCQKTCDWEEQNREALLLGGKAPHCGDCAATDQGRRDRGKRGTAVGTLRPNIVLYGEEHPSADLLSPITKHDLGLGPEVLLILGTSLRVHGLKILVKEFAKSVHARAGKKGKVIFVNRTRPPGSIWDGVIDYWVEMDCDNWVEDVRRRRPDLWQRQGELNLQVKKTLATSSRGGLCKKLVSEYDEDKENDIVVGDLLPILGQPEIRNTGPMRQSERKPAAMNTMERSASISGKKSKPRTPLKAMQLPTPPSSGRTVPTSRAPADGYQLSDDRRIETPCKRRKTSVQIWEDAEWDIKAHIETNAGEDPEEMSQMFSFPKRVSSVQIRFPPAVKPSVNNTHLTKKRKRISRTA